MPVNLYDILGIDSSCTQADIVKAYRMLARKYHPDKNPGDALAQKMFCRVSAAHQFLIQQDIREQLQNGTVQCIEDSDGKLSMVAVAPGDHTVFDAAKAWVPPDMMGSAVPVRGKAPFIPEYIRDSWARTSHWSGCLGFFSCGYLWGTPPDSYALNEFHTRLMGALDATIRPFCNSDIDNTLRTAFVSICLPGEAWLEVHVNRFPGQTPIEDHMRFLFHQWQTPPLIHAPLQTLFRLNTLAALLDESVEEPLSAIHRANLAAVWITGSETPELGF